MLGCNSIKPCISHLNKMSLYLMRRAVGAIFFTCLFVNRSFHSQYLPKSLLSVRKSTIRRRRRRRVDAPLDSRRGGSTMGSSLGGLSMGSSLGGPSMGLSLGGSTMGSSLGASSSCCLATFFSSFFSFVFYVQSHRLPKNRQRLRPSLKE